MNLSKNFTYHELVKSKIAAKLGIDNTPNKREIKRAKYLADNVLQPTRDWYNVIINIESWFRCEELNSSEEIGGSDRSLHRFAAAVDVDSVGDIPLIDVIEHIYNNLPFTELIAEYLPYGWIHVGLIKGRENDKKLMIKDKDHDYEIVTMEYLREFYGKTS